MKTFAERHPGKAAQRVHRVAAAIEAGTNGGRLVDPSLARRELGLAAELFASGRCAICGRKLSDPASLRRGVGPDCTAKVGARYVETFLERARRAP